MPIKNPIIQKAAAAIDAKVQPKYQDAYNRIVIAGMKVMFSEQLAGELMQGLKASQQPVITAAEGVIGILGILYKESRKTMPLAPMVMAGMNLLLQALDAIDQTGIMKIDNNAIGIGTQHYIESLLPKLGITPDKLQAILGQVGQVASDPGKMAQIKQGAPA